MKHLLTFSTLLLLACEHRNAPTITEQQLHCLNRTRADVQRSADAARQIFYRREESIYLFKTPDDHIVGYLFEQGECSAVMTQLPPDGREQAEQYIAAKIKQNHGPTFRTKANQPFQYYTAEQGGETYVVAQAF